MTTRIYPLTNWTDGNGTFTKGSIVPVADSVANIYRNQGLVQFADGPAVHYPMSGDTGDVVTAKTDPLTGGSEISIGASTLRQTAGVTVAATIDETLFAQDATGKYWMTQNDATYGVYGDQLATATGVPGVSLTKTALTNTRGANLLTSTGSALTYAAPAHVWPMPSGGAIYSAKATGNKWFLYKVTPAGTVGANSPTFDDKKAVLDIGLFGGTQTADIGSLTSRSMCVANIAGSTVLLFGEYNVASGRVAGGSKDQVRVWKSTDEGATWSVLLEFNTGGANIVRHIHAIVQDPVTGMIYIATGDDPKAAIIRWDGVSAAPASNSTYAQISATPGWQVLTDATNKFRTCDVVRVGNVLSYMRDSSLAADKISQMLTASGLMVPVNGGVNELSAGRDPIMGIAIPGGGALYLSMWLDPTSTRTYDVFNTADGVNYRKILEIPDYGTASSGVIGAAYISNLGNLILAGCPPKGAYLKAGSAGGSVVLTLS